MNKPYRVTHAVLFFLCGMHVFKLREEARENPQQALGEHAEQKGPGREVTKNRTSLPYLHIPQFTNHINRNG